MFCSFRCDHAKLNWQTAKVSFLWNFSVLMQFSSTSRHDMTIWDMQRIKYILVYLVHHMEKRENRRKLPRWFCGDFEITIKPPRRYWGDFNITAKSPRQLYGDSVKSPWNHRLRFIIQITAKSPPDRRAVIWLRKKSARQITVRWNDLENIPSSFKVWSVDFYCSKIVLWIGYCIPIR